MKRALRAIDEAEIALRERYAARLVGIIPAIGAARYLQIERKICAVVEYDLADGISLVEWRPAPAVRTMASQAIA